MTLVAIAGCGGGSTMQPQNGSAIAFAKQAFPRRYGGAYIDRSVHPAVRRVLVKDATDGDRAQMAGFERVEVSASKYSYRELIEAKNAAIKTLSRRDVAFDLIAPRVVQQNVLVTTPHTVTDSVRRAISAQAGPVPVLFHVRPPVIHSAKTVQKPWILVKSSPASKELMIGVESGYCVGDGRPRISRAAVNETPASVTVTAFLHTPGYKSNGACAGVGYNPTRTVRLRAPLGGRRLLDGSTSPPTPVRR